MTSGEHGFSRQGTINYHSPGVTLPSRFPFFKLSSGFHDHRINDAVNFPNSPFNFQHSFRFPYRVPLYFFPTTFPLISSLSQRHCQQSYPIDSRITTKSCYCLVWSLKAHCTRSGALCTSAFLHIRSPFHFALSLVTASYDISVSVADILSM